MSYERFEKQLAEGHAENALKERATALFGTRGDHATFYRFVILDVVFDPMIIDDSKISYWEHELNVTNIKFAKSLPRNTIIAQRVLEGTASDAEKPMFLFPFFPPSISLPCNPGEHVWVMFEDRSNKRIDVGYWICRITGPGYVEDVNHTHMPRALDDAYVPGTKDTFNGNEPDYLFNLGKTIEQDGVKTSSVETSTIATEDEHYYEKLLTDTDAGKIRTYEAIPRYKKRPGDVVLEGNNNSLISLGTHRTGTAADYDIDDIKGKIPKLPDSDVSGTGKGCIDLVVGRGQTDKTSGKSVKNSLGNDEVAKHSGSVIETEGDPDLANDRSRILLTQRSRIDVDMGLDGFNGSIGIEDTETGDAGVVVKSDKIRFIARSDIEILVSGFERDENGRMKSSTDEASYAAIIIKSNGDIVIKPSEKGFLKLGGDDADKAIVCTDTPAIATNGNVTAAPLVTTMGGQFANTGVSGQGTYSSKILVK